MVSATTDEPEPVLASALVSSSGTWRRLKSERASMASAATVAGGACSARAAMRSAMA
jgi:hypothetical protein